MKMKTQHAKICGKQQKRLREVYSNSGLPQQRRKIQNRQSKTASKGPEKRTTNKSPNQQKKGNNKNQSRNKRKRQ